MDFKEAKDLVRDLGDHFLPKERDVWLERIAPAYDKKEPGARLPGFSFGVVAGQPAAASQNERPARILITVHRAKGAPKAPRFRQIVEKWLKDKGHDARNGDFIFHVAAPLQALLEPDRNKRAILKGPCFPIGPGAMISVGDNYHGALGCFAKRPDGTVVGVGSAHVLRREGRQNPSSMPVWQPRESAPNRTLLGHVCRPNETDWSGEHDICEFELAEGAGYDPGFLPGLPSRLTGLGSASKGDRVWKHGPGTGVWAGEIVAEKVLAPVWSRTDEASTPEWRVADAYFVRGLFSGPFATNKDSGCPVFKEDGTLVGLVVAGLRVSDTQYDTVVVDAATALESASLTLICDRFVASGAGS